MYLDVLIFGLLLGLVRKGSIRNLGQLPLQGLAWFLCLGALELGMQFTQAPERRTLYTVLIMVSGAVGAVLLWLNRKLPGVWLVFAGLALNFAVMAANGGRMPVSEWAAVVTGQQEHLPQLISGESSRHLLLTASTPLGFLGDVIPLPRWYPVPRVLSIGDIFIGAGVIRLMVWGMAARR